MTAKEKKQNMFTFKSLNKRLFVLLVVVGGVFFVSQIIVMSQVGTKSQEVDLIRAELDDVRKENEILIADIDKEKSIKKIEDSIEGQDFAEKNIGTLTEDNSVAEQ